LLHGEKLGRSKKERSQDRGGKLGISLHEPNRSVKGLKEKNISWCKKITLWPTIKVKEVLKLAKDPQMPIWKN